METSRVAAIPLFAGLAEAQLAAVAARASELQVETDQLLTDNGDFGHALFMIESGTADVTDHGEHLRTLGPGDVFGEVAVIASGRRTATVTTTSPMQLIVLFKRDVWALEKEAPDVSLRIRGLLAEHPSSVRSAT
jgi:CPA1 family monovalent cation:H+ antiporter